ncbi:uncharacterized protein LOC123553417 [Mercenaria mercenaria]|uniref:uncharacterized protein LOC123553417 n=1 Tax=Mercenaria mercenaria TaxID=6596 RepID=UPI00234F5E71|nr:uncharacterized protein LOC123553417 [Mercenaria mercenaria]
MDEDTIRWILSDTSVDPLSNVPVSAVVFMLYYGLELKHFLLNISEDIVENYNPELRDYKSTSLYLAGSAAQGFYLNTNDFFDARDVDIVSILKKDVRNQCEFDKKQINEVKTEERNEEENARQCKGTLKENTTIESPPFYLNVETWEDTYPGYVMLRKCRKDELPVQMSLSHRYVSSAETARSRTEYWDEMQTVLADIFRSGIDEEWGSETLVFEDVESQGPAASSTFTNIFLDVQLNADLVFALPYPGWPEIAREWQNRQAKSGWPSLELKQNILASGCLIVPKGQKGSRVEEYEWRISFSLAELKLARSLSRVQREIVHILKAFISDRHETGFTGIEAKLDSYFIINLLFTESENTNANEWTENNIANLLFRVLDRLEDSIRSKNLPHYFIPNNNLLHKLTFQSVKLGKGEFTMGYFDEMMDVDEYIDFALYTVMRVRYDPLNQVLLQNKYVQLSGAIRKAVFEPLIMQAKSSSKVEGKMYLTTVLRLAKAHFFQLRFREAYLYIEDTLKFYMALGQPKLTDNERRELEILRAVCAYLVGDYDTAKNLFEEIEKTLQTTKDTYLEENKYIYSAFFARTLLSLSQNTAGKENKILLSKTEMLLLGIADVNSSDVPTNIYLELVNYLMNLGRYEEADTILNNIRDSLGVEGTTEIFEESIDDKQEPGYTPTQTNCNSEEELEHDMLEDSTQTGTSGLDADEVICKSNDEAIAMDTCSKNTEEIIYKREPCTESKVNTDLDAENACSLEQKDEHLQESMQTESEEDTVRLLIDRHVNQDLLNQYALFQAFKKLGLQDNAEKVFQKLNKKLLQRQNENPDVTMEALDHDYMLYMSYRNEETLQDDWETPLCIFKERVVFCTADEYILDDILKSVVKDFGVIRITGQDLYFHYRIQLLKHNGKLSEAMHLIEHIQDQDLAVNHYNSLGEREKAEDAAFYARLDRDGGGRSVAKTLKQWIEKLFEAARKYELRNVYLDSVFT